MLPVIEEQLLIIKILQGTCQTLLCLALGYLAGEILFNLPGKALSAANATPAATTFDTSRPRILTGKRTGLLIALLMACNLLLMKIAYRPALFSGPFWGGLTALFIVGLALILIARQHLKSTRPTGPPFVAAALIGDLLLLGVCFLLLNAESLLLTPRYWPLLGEKPLLLLSWHGTLRFAQFALLGLMLTGLDRQKNHQRLILAAALLWLPLQILDLLLVPGPARSAALYLWSSLALLTATGLALLIARSLLKKRLLPLAVPLSFVVLLTMLWVLGAQTARETALAEPSLTGRYLEKRSFEAPIIIAGSPSRRGAYEWPPRQIAVAIPQ